jgi:protein transport protein SEC23
VIGNIASLSKKTPYVGETEIGIGGTSAWRICCLDTKSTYAFYFECTNQQAAAIPPGSQRYFQVRHATPSACLRSTLLAWG